MSHDDTRLDHIARVAYEATRAYQHVLGEAVPNPPWDEAPGWAQVSARAGIRAVLTGSASTPREQHEQWMAARIAEGWVYGPVKDTAAKTHPDLLPYDALPECERRKNVLFRAVAHALSDPV